jgi:peptide/nickel transport system permease protein
MKDFLRVFFSRPIPLVGLVIFAVIVALALLAPLLFGRGPFIIVGMPLLPPGAPGLLAGSDVLGRDMAVGLAYGARISLLVGITSTLCAVGIGVLLGAVAGYYGGWLDDLLMRVTEFFQIIPSFVLLMVLVAFLQPSLSSPS